MKILTILFLLVPFLQEEVVPKKGDRVVWIKNGLTADENYKQVGMALADLEYSVDERDADFGTFTTSGKLVYDPIGGTHMQTVFVVARDSSIRITSTSTIYHEGKPYDSPRDLVFRKKVLGSYGLFGNLIQIAESVDGKISFSN